MEIPQSTKMQIVNHAERNLLAVMIYSPIAVNDILAKVRKSNFLTYQHQAIFDAINTLVNNQIIVNLESLFALLLKNNVIDKIGGVQYLTDVAEEYIDDENTNQYIKIVREAYHERQLMKIVRKAELEVQKQKDIETILFETEEALMELRSNGTLEDFIKISDITQKTVNKIETMANRDTIFTGVPSGFDELDDKTLGFQNGDLIILAARPSMGKTAFALNLVKNITIESAPKEKKYSIAFISLEMPAQQLVERILSSTALVESKMIRTGKGLSGKDWKHLTTASDLLKKSTTFIYDSPKVTLQQIQNQLRQLCRREEIDIVIIDYLQLLGITDKKFNSRQEEIGNISRHLKLLARELRIPIICLSQLSRSVEKRDNKRPIMSDLRDSGAIEQDADLVMFLYRDDYYKMKDDDFVPSNTAELIISKHRNGPTGIVHFSFAEKHGLFDETA